MTAVESQRTVREYVPVDVELKEDARKLVESWRRQNPSSQSQVRLSGLLDIWSDQGARRIQLRLKELGYYSLDVDGRWGAGSRAALQRFKEGVPWLPTDDHWDESTQRALFGN
jgi:hypothetical protein